MSSRTRPIDDRSEQTASAGPQARGSGARSACRVFASVRIARTADQWLHGSLAATSFADVALLLVSIGILGLVLAVIYRDFRALELDDETARSLGVRTARVRLALVIVAALLTGTATAVSGPIGFTALAAPQLARRAMGTSGVPVIGSAVTGATVLVVADVIAQRALAPLQLPWACSPPRSAAPTCSGSSHERAPMNTCAPSGPVGWMPRASSSVGRASDF
ncbi:iron chelate uptake ABC transporter family permease subunit [Microbacterium trichothecenolyticum]|uniref:iron chelate uptake ABC transporter family permease subunit n=1 Tax=Microbacterium trichothecenolyticum TaxID=69370 RepID=UPI00358DF9E8